MEKYPVTSRSDSVPHSQWVSIPTILLSDINVGYNYNVNERVTTKASGDFNLGLGGNAGQFINLSGGAEYYPVTNQKFTRTKPYVTGDAGYGFARNGQTHAAGSGGNELEAVPALNSQANS